MMASTLKVLFCSLAIVSLASCAPRSPINFFSEDDAGDLNHSYFEGEPSLDSKTYAEELVRIPARGSVIVSKEVTINTSSLPIDYILLFDLEFDGTGGYAKIIDGGVGKNSVTVSVNSQKGYGINFYVIVSVKQPN